jgi:hypothetical protein
MARGYIRNLKAIIYLTAGKLELSASQRRAFIL